MLIIVLPIILGILIGRLNKRSVELNVFKIRYVILATVILLIHRIVTSILGIDVGLIYVEIISTLMFIVFMVYNLKEIPIVLICTGKILNGLVMIANGGKMPVVLDNIQALDNRHMAILNVTQAKLGVLCDWIYPVYPFSIGNVVISLGDIVVSLGLFWIILNLFSKNYKSRLTL